MVVRLGVGQDAQLLLAHSSSDNISLTKTESGNLVQNLHNLFLVNRFAIGRSKDFPDAACDIHGLFSAVLGVDDALQILHRTRSISGHKEDDILNAVRLELTQHGLHAVRLELEHGIRFAGGENVLENIRVIHGDLFHVDGNTLVPFDAAETICDNVQVFQAQEVHLEKSGIMFGLFFVALGNPKAIIVLHEGDVFANVVIIRNDNACSVHTVRGSGALHQFCVFDQALGNGVGLTVFVEFSLSVRDDGIRFLGDQSCDFIHNDVRNISYAAGSTNGAFAGERALCGDVADSTFTIFCLDIINDLLTFLSVQIGIDIFTVPRFSPYFI